MSKPGPCGRCSPSKSSFCVDAGSALSRAGDPKLMCRSSAATNDGSPARLPVPATTTSLYSEYVAAAHAGVCGATPLYAKIEFVTVIGDAHVTPVEFEATVLNVNTAGLGVGPVCAKPSAAQPVRIEFSMSYFE